MSDTEVTGDKQRPAHLFKPGHSGNPAGRPKGARSKLSEAFLQDLHEVWEQHGVTALEECATKRPAEFCRIVASLLPSDVNLNITTVDVTDFAAKYRSALSLLGNHEVEVPGERLPLRARMIEHRPRKITNGG